VLALMGYMLTPDVTTGSLGIANAATGNPDLRLNALGGGFTVKKESPLYLEGTLGYAQYDPTFTDANSGAVATNWIASSATGGVGWDFPVAKELVLRPIFNFSYGRVESRVSASGQGASGEEIEFLRDGHLDAYGLGGSLVLDYERTRRENAIDLELRYTNIYLQSFGDSSTAVKGSADAQSVSLWTRWRAPTGMTTHGRPLRYVLEYAHTAFLGDLKGALGFNDLNSFGTGLEIDSSAYGTLVTRARLMARYRVGASVSGWQLGFAVDF
jgi:hypothetical protein